MYKRGLSIVIGTLIIIFLVLVAIGIVWIVKEKNPSKDNLNEQIDTLNEPGVYRTFSSITVAQGEQIDVTLQITLGSVKYYAVEEYIPAWTIIDDADGVTGNPTKLVWFAFGSISLSDITITYTLQAPSTPGNYVFDGVYQFEGDASSITTKGQTIVTVI